MIISFFVGINEANRSWKMILLLLAANVLLSLPVIVPVFLLVFGDSRGTIAADSLMADKLDAVWLMDVANHQFPGAAVETVALQAGGLFVLMGVCYLLLNTLLTGGVIGVFNSTDGLFTMRKFWGEAGAYFWRFFRLTLISLIFYGVAVGIYALLRWTIKNAQEQASAFESVIYKKWAAMALPALLFVFINMVFDYAKIGTVVRSDRWDSKGMFRETFRAFRFAFGNFFSAFGLYLVIALVGLVVFRTLNSLRWSVNQSSAGGVLLAILLGQIAIAWWMWTRMVFYAAEIHLYKKPSPITAPKPAMVEPQLEFARAKGPEGPVGWSLSLNCPAPTQKRRHLALITRDCKSERRLAVLHLRVDFCSVFEQQSGEFDVAVGGGLMKRREAAFGLSSIYIRAVSDQKTRDGDLSGRGGGM